MSSSIALKHIAQNSRFSNCTFFFVFTECAPCASVALSPIKDVSIFPALFNVVGAIVFIFELSDVSCIPHVKFDNEKVNAS